MNKACDRSKAKVRKDEINRKTSRNKRSPETSDNAEVDSARIPHQINNSAEVKVNDCGDVPEQPLSSQETFIDGSQDTGCPREVRWWNYQSPETVKKLRKCRGQYSCDEIRKIVDIFSDTGVQSEDSLLHSVKLYLPSQDEATFSRLSNQSKPRERVVKKYKQRALNRDSVQHMLTALKEQVEKPKRDCRKPLKRLSDGSTAPVSDPATAHVSDIYERSDVIAGPALSQSFVNKDDISWSDEDLFKDNSFIIEATQNSEKFMAPVAEQGCLEQSEKTQRSAQGDCLASVTASQAKEPVGHQTLFVDSFVIPPTCNSKQSSVTGAKSSLNVPTSSSLSVSSNITTSNKCKNVQTGIDGRIPSYPSVKYNPGQIRNTSQSFKTNSTATSRLEDKNSYCPVAGFRSCSLNNKSEDRQAIQNSQSIIVNPAPDGKYKTSFRKFSSFSISGSQTTTQHDCGGSNKFGNPHTNSSFRKTLSFDSSVSPSRVGGNLNMQSRLSVVSNNFSKPKSTCVSRDSRSERNDSAKPKLPEYLPEKVSSVPVVQEDGFDVSLPEEVFEKLLEIDEILDSQASAISITSAMNLQPKPGQTAMNLLPNPGRLCDTRSGHVSDGSSVSKVKLSTAASYVNLKPNNAAACTTTANIIVNDNSKSVAPKAGKQHLTTSKPTGSLVSPVRSVVGLQDKNKLKKSSPVHAYYKKTFSLQQRRSPRHLKTENHSQVHFPSSSTPVKGPKNDGSDDVDASFLDTVFDDSFSNDQALFESQIVPFLEKVEADATLTQNEPSVLEPSILTKCSSEEIEQKRKAALHKRNLKLSQSK
ncbi:hypothetical protein BsWGS_15417 [Bradybaena similaris]